MKRYKAILNIGYIDEKIIYFDNLTVKKVKEIESCNSYVVLFYDNFFNKYLGFGSKVNEYQKAIFNENLQYYIGN